MALQMLSPLRFKVLMGDGCCTVTTGRSQVGYCRYPLWMTRPYDSTSCCRSLCALCLWGESPFSLSSISLVFGIHSPVEYTFLPMCVQMLYPSSA